MKKKLKIVDEFSNIKYKSIMRNIFYQNYKNNPCICVRMICPIEKKLYNKTWSLKLYDYNEALYYAIKDLNYINSRKEDGDPLKYYTIKYWVTPTEYILL